MPAIGRELVDASVSIAIRDVKISLRGERCVSARMERQVTHQGRRLTRHADLRQQFSLRRAPADGMVSIIGTVQRVVRGDMEAMRMSKKTMAPGAQYVAFPVEHDHWVLAPGEQEHAIVAVYADRRDVA